jgi:hypothetical protein
MAAKLKIEKRGDEILIVHCFRGEDLNVIFYQNMSNLYNRYISAERKISQKNPEYMLKSLLLCLYSSNLGTFWLKIEQFWPFEEISIFSNGGHLGYRTALTGCRY